MAKETYYKWEWDLASSREDLWPEVSNTERFNKAIGLPEPTFTDEPKKGGGHTRTAIARQVGLALKWVENPYEWIAPRTLGVVRDYQSGPTKQVRSRVTLEPLERGTHLTHEIWVVPSGFLGAGLIIGFEIGRKLKASMDRVYRHIDEQIQKRLAEPAKKFALAMDAFEQRIDHLSSQQHRRLVPLSDKLKKMPRVEELPADTLLDHIRHAPDHLVERMRPWALADSWGLEKEAVLEAFVAAARIGILELGWDLLCPNCRIASEEKRTLGELRAEGHCSACNIDYELNFEQSVELVFKPSPAIRKVEVGTYCVGGPGHKPHVAAQQWLKPGESREFELLLAPGQYRIHGERFKPQIYLTVAEGGSNPDQIALTIGAGGTASCGDTARAGVVKVTCTNGSAEEQTIRLDTAKWRENALTAAEATSRTCFRDAFSTEVVAPGMSVNVGHMAILFTDLEASTQLYESIGDARAYAVVREHFEILRSCAARWRGAIVKTIGDAIMGAWHDPRDAVLAALEFQHSLRQNMETSRLNVKVGIHFGSCIAVNLNDVLDYFGTSVNMAARLERQAGAGEVAISHDLFTEPTVSAYLRSHTEIGVEQRQVQLKGLSGEYRIAVLSRQSDDIKYTKTVRPIGYRDPDSVRQPPPRGENVRLLRPAQPAPPPEPE